MANRKRRHKPALTESTSNLILKNFFHPKPALALVIRFMEDGLQYFSSRTWQISELLVQISKLPKLVSRSVSRLAWRQPQITTLCAISVSQPRGFAGLSLLCSCFGKVLFKN